IGTEQVPVELGQKATKTRPTLPPLPSPQIATVTSFPTPQQAMILPKEVPVYEQDLKYLEAQFKYWEGQEELIKILSDEVLVDKDEVNEMIEKLRNHHRNIETAPSEVLSPKASAEERLARAYILEKLPRLVGAFLAGKVIYKIPVNTLRRRG